MAYEDLPEEARAQIGKETQPLPSPVAVEQSLIDHWLEVFEDSNPVYWDEEFAKKTRYGGLIAPPGMMHSLTMPHKWTVKGGPTDPTDENIQRGTYFKMKRLLGFSNTIVQNSKMEWYIPLRMGDRFTSYEVVRDVSPLKKTRVGEGRFWTTDLILKNQKGEIVGKQSWTSFGWNAE